jgi:hypothetical protein
MDTKPQAGDTVTMLSASANAQIARVVSEIDRINKP